MASAPLWDPGEHHLGLDDTITSSPALTTSQGQRPGFTGSLQAGGLTDDSPAGRTGGPVGGRCLLIFPLPPGATARNLASWLPERPEETVDQRARLPPLGGIEQNGPLVEGLLDTR